jgi:hypothetical protein
MAFGAKAKLLAVEVNLALVAGPTNAGHHQVCEPFAAGRPEQPIEHAHGGFLLNPSPSRRAYAGARPRDCSNAEIWST